MFASAKLMMAISQLKSKFVRVNKDDENSSESNSTSGIANTSSPSTNNSSSDQLRFADMASQIDAIRRSQCVATFSLDGTILDANDVFLNAMGYTLAEVKGKHHRMFVSSEYSASREYAQFWVLLPFSSKQVNSPRIVLKTTNFTQPSLRGSEKAVVRCGFKLLTHPS